MGFGARWEPAGDAGRRERGDAGRWERGDGERLLGGINKCIGREGHGEFSLMQMKHRNIAPKKAKLRDDAIAAGTISKYAKDPSGACANERGSMRSEARGSDNGKNGSNGTSSEKLK